MTTHKQLFIEHVLYSNPKIVADDNQYKLVQAFIDLNGDDFFEEAELMADIFDAWNEFKDNQ